MGRKLRTTLPMNPRNLIPRTPDLEHVRNHEQNAREKSKENFDRRHAAQQRPALKEGEEVWMKDREESGTVVAQHNPRSYLVKTDKDMYRRNTTQLEKMNPSKSADTTKSGRNIRTPARYLD